MNKWAHLSKAELERIANSDKHGKWAHLSKAELERIASQEESPLGKAGRAVARTGKDYLAGLGDFTDTFTSPVREIINYPLRKVGAKYQIPALGEETERAIDTATSGYTAPRNDAEKTISSGVRFVAPLGAGSVTNLASKTAATGTKYISKLGQRTKDLLQMGNSPTPGNITSSVAAGSAMQHVLNEDPENIGGALVASFLGGAAPGAAPAVRNALSHGGKKLFSVVPERVTTLDKVGVPLSLGDASDNPVVKKIQNAINHTTLVDNQLSKNFKILENKIKEKLGLPSSGIITNEGKVGEYSKEGIKELKNHVSNIYTDLQDRAIRALMENSETKEIPIKEAATFIQNFINHELENNQTLTKVFKSSPAGKSFYDMIEPAARESSKNPKKDALIKKLQSENFQPQLIEEIITKEFPEKTMEELSLSYKPLKYIRTKIGKKGRKSFGQISDQEEGQLDKLYGSLSEDIGNQIEETGAPQARTWWKLGNDVWSRFKGKTKDHLNPFLSIVNTQPKDAPYLIAKDLGDQGELFRLITPYLKPGEKKEFLQGIVGALGERDGKFNYGKFATEVHHMGDAEKKMFFKTLAKENGVQEQDIKNIIDVIDYSKETLAQANTSQTAQHAEIYDGMKKFGKAVGALVGGKVALGMTGIGGIGSALIGSWAANKHLFANPKAIRAMAYASKMTEAKQIPVWIHKVSQIPGFPKDLTEALISIYKQEISKGTGYTGSAIIGKSAKTTLGRVQLLNNPREESKEQKK